MKKNLKALSLTVAGLLSFCLSSTGFALPADPTNVCGGNGSCDSEGDELAFWEADIEDLEQEWEGLDFEFHVDCVDYSPGSYCLNILSSQKAIEQLLVYARGERDVAQGALEACIDRTSCD